MQKQQQYITVERAQFLQETFDFLGNYEGDENFDHLVGNSLEDVDVQRTMMLRELAATNKRRKELIAAITA